MHTKMVANPLPNESPCVRNCCLDTDNVCLGCGRSLAEILEWHRADTVRQDTIREQAKSRLETRFNNAQIAANR